NEIIAQKLPVECEKTSVERAKEQGARAQFLDKYKGSVTMYSIGDYSRELCKGPHVKNTSELGHFKIIKEEASSAGVRRIKATLK
ncbi:alanine--tRNA ligase, partial [Patescibacteria group bacterium]|nr:alanine--tRNA ligase [Patescibacteria group bacterium]